MWACILLCKMLCRGVDYRMVFAQNNFDINTFIVVVLAGKDVFNGGVIVIDMFSYAVMDADMSNTLDLGQVVFTRRQIEFDRDRNWKWV